MKKKILFTIVALIFIWIFAGCDSISSLFGAPKKGIVQKGISAVPVKGTVVAKVGGIPITLEDLNQEITVFNELMDSNNKPEAKIATRDKKIEYLKSELVRRDLLYLEALKRGLDKNEDILRELEKTKINLLVMALLKDESAKVDVSDKEVEDYYNNYKDQLKEPEERQIREIMVPTEQEAREILVQLLQGADFATMAKDKSRAASSKEGGDLGFIKKGKKSAQFDAVAFSDTLEVGKYSNIFRGPDGYYILKLEAKRGGRQKSLSDLWDDIKRVITFLKQQQRIDDLVNKLSKEYQIEISEGEIR